jgi:hypothetical protein
MDYAQSVLRLHPAGDLAFAVADNGSSLLAAAALSFRLDRAAAAAAASQASYTTVQVALLLIPSAVLLLLLPARAFQLRRASLKVLPNYTGAIKAVGPYCWGATVNRGNLFG